MYVEEILQLIVWHPLGAVHSQAQGFYRLIIFLAVRVHIAKVIKAVHKFTAVRALVFLGMVFNHFENFLGLGILSHSA